MKPYYYVYNHSRNAPRVRHETLEAAEAESLRLAKKQPGHAFEILQCVGITRITHPQTFWLDGVDPDGEIRDYKRLVAKLKHQLDAALDEVVRMSDKKPLRETSDPVS